MLWYCAIVAVDHLTSLQVRDIGALLDWIQTQENLDSSRVVVYGGSYGGYMSLAVSFHYPERIVAAIDVVGISNFVTFLTNTESYRRDLRRAECAFPFSLNRACHVSHDALVADMETSASPKCEPSCKRYRR